MKLVVKGRVRLPVNARVRCPVDKEWKCLTLCRLCYRYKKVYVEGDHIFVECKIEDEGT